MAKEPGKVSDRLDQAKELMYQGKHDEAFQITERLANKKELIGEKRLAIQLFQTQILIHNIKHQ